MPTPRLDKSFTVMITEGHIGRLGRGHVTHIYDNGVRFILFPWKQSKKRKVAEKIAKLQERIASLRAEAGIKRMRLAKAPKKVVLRKRRMACPQCGKRMKRLGKHMSMAHGVVKDAPGTGGENI